MKGNEGKDSGDKYSLRGRVYERIRSDILDGVYKDHEELKEATLGEKMYRDAASFYISQMVNRQRRMGNRIYCGLF